MTRQPARRWLGIGLLLLGSGAPLSAGTVTYSYDAAGRLSGARYSDGGQVSYTYDTGGNLQRRRVERSAAAVQFGAASGTGAETQSPVLIEITLSAAVAQEVAVDLAVVGGTATPGTDFALSTATVTFAPGETRAYATLTVNDDTICEALEDIHLELLQATNAGVGAVSSYAYVVTDEDTDDDTLSDDWEELYFAALTEVADGDPDHDGATNLQEQAAGSDPTGLSWAFALNVTHAQTAELAFGLAWGASDGAGDAFDLTTSSLADVSYAAFVSEDMPDLAADWRGVTRTATWRLRVHVPADRADSEISWDPLAVPAGGLIIVARGPDGSLRPDVALLDMQQESRIAVAAGTTADYAILFRQAVFVLELTPGWNLASLPITLDAVGVAEMLARIPGGAVWGWDPSRGYRQASALVAGQGFWVFRAAAAGTGTLALALAGERSAVTAASLSVGWNLLGPMSPPPFAALPLPLSTDPPDAIDGRIWRWGREHYQQAEQLESGVGYWIRGAAPADIRLAP